MREFSPAPQAAVTGRLRPLSQVQASDDLPQLGCAEAPGPHCGLFEAALAPPLPGTYTLLIGPAACLYHARMTLLPRTRGPGGLADNLLLLPMDQTDVVFGVDERLTEAVLAADRRFRPAAVFLVSTCVPEMIGTDLEALVRSLQGQVGARLLPVRTDGFSARHQQLGQRRMLAALARTMAPQPVRPRSVNILGLRGPGGQETELAETLRHWGAEVLCTLPGAGTLAEVQQAPAAALNLVVAETGLDLAREMEQRFGTPYLNIGFPLGADQVEAAYAAVAAALGVAAGSAPAGRVEAARQAMARARRRVGGLRGAVAAFAGGALGAAGFLADLGVEPEVVFLHRLLPADRAQREALLARGIDPLVARSLSTQDTAAVCQALGVQVYAGHGDRHGLARLGIAHVHPDPPRALWGFAATGWAAEMLAHAACELAAAGRGTSP